MAASPQQADPQEGTPDRPAPAPPFPAGKAESGPGAPPEPTLRREWLLLGLSLLVLAAIVAPPLVNLGRYQHRIMDTMSRSLGRPVTMRSVTLRLLPTPALVLDDVVVGEQPGFGAEPALRAPRLTAQLRLTSLYRARLEVSHVAIADASLNLVRNAAGQWDIGSLLLQASQVPNAPTGQRRAGPAPRFPYIEITDSRVNLKQGVEKLPYSLLNANLSVWLAEPEVWQLKLQGQPVRTDVELGLSDTGLLRIEGRLHRGNALARMPLALQAEWMNAPLGQATRLLSGADRGWRGNMHATAAFAGELDNLRMESHLLIEDLHTEDFTPAQPFSVDATCSAHWARPAHLLNEVSCRWPVGKGQLLLTGQASTTLDLGTRTMGTQDAVARVSPGAAAGAPGGAAAATRLLLTADTLPADFLLAAAGLARSDFVPAFSLEGTFSGPLTYAAQPGSPAVYGGSLLADELRLTADGRPEPLVLREARITAATPGPSGVPTLLLTSEPVDLGGPIDATLSAQVTAGGVLLHGAGSAAVARLGELGRATHLLPVALAWLAPGGTAEFDVTRGAAWQQGDAQPEGSAFPLARPAEETPLAPTALAVGSAPTLTGWLRLRGVRYTPPFLAQPVLLPTAQATFSAGSIAWNVPTAIVGPIHLQLTATYPTECAAALPCRGTFHANTGLLDAADVRAALFGASEAPTQLLSQWMRSLNRSNAHWPPITGTVHANSLIVGRLALRGVDAMVSIGNGGAELRSLDAEALGGVLHAGGTLRRDGRTPGYELSLVLAHASAAAAGSLFHENWGAGTLTASSSLQLSGTTAAELAGSATGRFEAQWLRGGVGGSSPLGRFASWTGSGGVGSRVLTLRQSFLNPATGAPSRTVTGTVGFDRSLELQIGEPAATGGAATPAAIPAPATQPALVGNGVTLVTGTLAHPAS